MRSMERPRVRRLYDPAEMMLIEELQREIWGYGNVDSDPLYPARCLFSFTQSGGLVSLATIADQPAGFAVAWTGRNEPLGVYLHSQLVGVLAAFRNRGVGLALKLHQRDFARQRGLPLIRWTFDPLRAANARFNLGKLGAVCREFRVNYYGSLTNRFSRGLDSDRLWVEWHLEAPRVEHSLAGRAIPVPLDLPQCLETEIVKVKGFPLVRPVNRRHPEREECLLEVPSDWDRVQHLSPEIALEWRKASREPLIRLLDRGYLVVDLARVRNGSLQRCYLHLVRRALNEVLDPGLGTPLR